MPTASRRAEGARLAEPVRDGRLILGIEGAKREGTSFTTAPRSGRDPRALEASEVEGRVEGTS